MIPLRILIVEDEPELLAGLVEQYQGIFSEKGYRVEIEQADTVDEARRLAKQAKGNPYDLVSLDVNLGDNRLTGLDVLDTLKRFRSAWMVALLTGVETDPSLDAALGESRAGDIRRQLRRDAYSRFPAERLQVVEKPSQSLETPNQRTLLANRLEQISLVYEEVGRLRYVFRPIEVTSLERIPQPKGNKGTRKFIETTALHWQIRYNCGEIRTLPNLSGFKTLHYLLSRDRNESVTPEDFVGNVVGDLTRRRGRVQGQELRGTAVAINAEVPLATMFGYSTDLRSQTQGRATFTMEFKHYESVPAQVAEEILAKAS